MTVLRGRLLVAEPTLADPNFHRTVVYLIEHSPEDGALGIVLNRPGHVPVGEIVPDWAPYVSAPDQVFVGGPVNPEGALCLARRSSAGPGPDDDVDPPPVFRPITTSIGAIDLHRDPTDAPDGISALRVFAGYAGWSPGQLEGELDLGGWYVVGATDDDVFTDHPDRLWRDVLRRQRGEVRAAAFHPEDPSVN